MVSVRWCDVNKGDDDSMEIRPRLVGREYKWQDPFMQGTFAATPPLASLKHLSSFMTTRRRVRGAPLRLRMLMMDVSRARVHAPCAREMYIRPPEEDATPGMVGKLLRAIYGARDASNQWDSLFNDIIAKLGYDVGVSNPCLYGRKTMVVNWVEARRRSRVHW